MTKKGFLSYAQDMRGHFVIGKVFTDIKKAEEYRDFLYSNMDRSMGPEMRIVDDVDITEVEIDDSTEERTENDLTFVTPFNHIIEQDTPTVKAVITLSEDKVIFVLETGRFGSYCVTSNHSKDFERGQHFKRVEIVLEKNKPYHLEIYAKHDSITNEEIDSLNQCDRLVDLFVQNEILGSTIYIYFNNQSEYIGGKFSEESTLWENLSLFEATKEEIEINEDFMTILKIMDSYHTKIASYLTYSIDVMNVRSFYYKDYTYDVDFTIKNKEERYAIGVYGLMFNPLRVFPLHISFDDELILCNNLEELTTKLDELFDTEFKDMIN